MRAAHGWQDLGAFVVTRAWRGAVSGALRRVEIARPDDRAARSTWLVLAKIEHPKSAPPNVTLILGDQAP